jgi:O-antigen ligase
MGVGTGDVNDAIQENLTKNNSQLKDLNIRTHNQYLTFLLTFGVVGTFIIVFFFVYAVRKEKLLSSPLIVAFLCIFLVSFISEDTLETAAGCLFTTFFFALFVVKKRVDIGH